MASCQSATERNKGVVKRVRTFVCVMLIFILRSNDDQGRLSRATDPYFISSVKSNRGLLFIELLCTTPRYLQGRREDTKSA